MKKFFVDHPSSVDETYFTHLRFASKSGLKLVMAGLACIVHSLLPFLFVTTASRTVQNINYLMENRGVKDNASAAES